jgi:hypothetical protein
MRPADQRRTIGRAPGNTDLHRVRLVGPATPLTLLQL